MEVFSNHASGTLSAGITASATTLTLQSGEGSPFRSPTGGQYFWSVIESGPRTNPTAYEIVQVTTRSVDTFTIVRGQQGTMSQSFASGDRFEHRFTAQTLRDIQSASMPATRFISAQGFQGGRGSDVLNPWGIGPLTNGGTISTPTLATTSQLAATGRRRSASSVAQGNAGRRTTNQGRLWRGNSSGRGGFKMTSRFGLGVDNATTRLFYGVLNADAFVTAAGNPSTQTTVAMVGFGFDDTVGVGGNYRLFNHDGGGGAVTVTDTLIARNATNLVAMNLHCSGSGAGITVSLTDTITGVSFSSFLTSSIPSTTTFLYYQYVVSGTSVVPGQIDIAELELWDFSYG